MTAKQTAVEWLIKELIESQYFPYGTPIILIEEAKEMEKQQIIDAWDNGQFNCGEFNNPTIIFGKQYYNETFKNTKE